MLKFAAAALGALLTFLSHLDRIMRLAERAPEWYEKAKQLLEHVPEWYEKGRQFLRDFGQLLRDWWDLW